jgi:hypothetical protein
MRERGADFGPGVDRICRPDRRKELNGKPESRFMREGGADPRAYCPAGKFEVRRA